MVPSVVTTPAGPEVPQYLTPLTTSSSKQLLFTRCSTSKDTTVIGKAGTPVMVHVSRLPYGDALDTQSPLTVHAPAEVNASARIRARRSRQALIPFPREFSACLKNDLTWWCQSFTQENHKTLSALGNTYSGLDQK